MMIDAFPQDSHALSRRLRAHALRMTNRARSSHIGSCLSMADILAVLYGRIMNVDPARPDWAERDRLIVSKGHAAAIVYAALAERGFIDRADLAGFCGDGSRLAGHVTRSVAGVELSTGSLGHGLPVAVGMALAAKRDDAAWRSICIVSDGELDEGSNWEAIQVAQHFRLDRLVCVVDYNKIQSFGSVAEVSDLHPLAAKFSAFNWGVREIDGHDHAALECCFAETPFHSGKPSVIVAHTVKGKGVSFMEGELLYHYRNPSDEDLVAALAEVEAAG
jgi:transketolase